MAYISFNTLDLSLAIPNIGDESRTDISAYWVKGNGLKMFGVNRYEESAWEI
jgi:hypothetical protein